MFGTIRLPKQQAAEAPAPVDRSGVTRLAKPVDTADLGTIRVAPGSQKIARSGTIQQNLNAPAMTRGALAFIPAPVPGPIINEEKTVYVPQSFQNDGDKTVYQTPQASDPNESKTVYQQQSFQHNQMPPSLLANENTIYQQQSFQHQHNQLQSSPASSPNPVNVRTVRATPNLPAPVAEDSIFALAPPQPLPTVFNNTNLTDEQIESELDALLSL